MGAMSNNGHSIASSQTCAASAFSNAWRKLDERVFKTINTQIITTHEKDTQEQLWKGHEYLPLMAAN
jgi:hypothetical protein